MKEYNMTPSVLTRLRRVVCPKCKKPIKVGDRVISTPSNGKSRIYHKKHWRIPSA